MPERELYLSARWLAQATHLGQDLRFESLRGRRFELCHTVHDLPRELRATTCNATMEFEDARLLAWQVRGASANCAALTPRAVLSYSAYGFARWAHGLAGSFVYDLKAEGASMSTMGLLLADAEYWRFLRTLAEMSDFGAIM